MPIAAMAGAVPAIIVLSLGAAALGGLDAVRLLFAYAGENPVIDIAICVLVLGVFTAWLLGTVLLARFVRKVPPAGRPRAGRLRAAPPPTDYLASITLVMSLAVALLVTVCLVLVRPVACAGSGRLLVDLTTKYFPFVVAAAAGGLLPYAMSPLLRRVGPWYARGAAPDAGRATMTHRAAARFTVLPLVAAISAACALIAVPFGERDAPAPRVSHGFSNMLVAGVVGASAALLVGLYRSRTGNAVPFGGGGRGPCARHDTRRLGRLIILAVDIFTRSNLGRARG